MVEAVEKAGVRQHGLVQLPPRAGRHAGQAAHRRGPAGPHLPLPRASSCRTGRSSPTCRRAATALWRLDVAAAGSGVTGDLLAHCIDTALWLNGPIDDAQRHDRDVRQGAQAQPDGQGREGRHRRRLHLHGPVRQRLAGDFESTRYARGHKALYTFEINGENASISWDLHDLHRLQYFDYRDEGIVRGWRSIHVSDGDQPYMGKWWVPGLQIGYEHSFVHQVADFIEGIASGKPAMPDFRDAYHTQLVLDAVLASAKKHEWLDVKQG